MAKLGLGESWAYGIGWAYAEWMEERSEGWAGLEGKRIFPFLFLFLLISIKTFSNPFSKIV